MEKNKIIVFYDGWCPLCKKTKKTITKFDFLRKFEFISFRDPEVMSKYKLDASKVALEMHSLNVKNGKMLKGFDSFIRFTLFLPLFIPFAPLMYTLKLLGLGDKTYNYIASKRTIIPVNQCDQECKINF
ncbi:MULTISPECIES: thiol-disulfide oxidoreductase DCC family protein [unclassified Exiguobacterium]|uniref:thiol-disulfide oxidoreductase DCC family protein n=1 Tax=unclassified Exiguobacterium TaxID=2644629 RepID=UPI001BE84838|nr:MULTISPECIES: DUF393 domain-containing protein [unclassified Exiguobacterium]